MDTFSPTIGFTTLRLLFQPVVQYGLDIQQTDVDAAYLYADPQEEIYMEQPKGCRLWASGAAPLVYKLLKAVYGLKQALFEWNSLLHSFLTYYGLHHLKCDSACYAPITPTLVVYVAVYVDDVLIFNSDP